MKLSVIILNYNVRYFLELCLFSVQKATQNIEAEIIVVDNNSSDDSVTMIKDRFKDVILIENKKNHGFPKGNNIGAKQAKGEFLCILNPDTIVREDTFTKVLEFIESKPDTGITGIKLIDGSGRFLRESKRSTPTPWVALTKIIGLDRVFPNWKIMNKYYHKSLNQDEIGKTDILVGAFMILRKQDYWSVGGFDEGCFMYADDIDLSYQIFKKKQSNWYFPKTTTIHFKGESTIKDKVFLNRFRESLNFFYKKHFRSYFFFDLFMKTGAYLFALYKKNEQPKEKITPVKHLIYSNDDLLIKKIQKTFKESLNTITNKTANTGISLDLPTAIYFDTNYVSTNEITDLMEIINTKNQAKNVLFYFISPKHDYVLNSFDSNCKGNITLIE